MSEVQISHQNERTQVFDEEGLRLFEYRLGRASREIVEEIDRIRREAFEQGREMGRWQLQRELQTLLGAADTEYVEEQHDALRSDLEQLSERVAHSDWRERR